MKKDNKRYYWIKLKTDFFNQETTDFLLSQKNGCQYIVLYQMLCLNTANTNGVMATRIGEMIVPYDVNKIVRDTKHFDFDTVTVALELFKRLGLIYEEDNQVLKIAHLEEMVGSESKWAEKKRLYREKQKELGQQEDNVQLIEDNVRQENRDKSIEYRDKILDIDIEKENKKESKKESNYDRIINELVNDNEVKEAVYEFIKMRKLMKKPMTDRALKQLINKLFTLSTNKQEQIQILDNSIINNWASIYPLKNENTKQGYKRQEIVPDWFNKEEPEKEPITPEEELEMLIGLSEGLNNPQMEQRIEVLKKQIADKNNLADRVEALKEKLHK